MQANIYSYSNKTQQSLYTRTRKSRNLALNVKPVIGSTDDAGKLAIVRDKIKREEFVSKSHPLYELQQSLMSWEQQMIADAEQR